MYLFIYIFVSEQRVQMINNQERKIFIYLFVVSYNVLNVLTRSIYSHTFIVEILHTFHCPVNTCNDLLFFVNTDL